MISAEKTTVRGSGIRIQSQSGDGYTACSILGCNTRLEASSDENQEYDQALQFN